VPKEVCGRVDQGTHQPLTASPTPMPVVAAPNTSSTLVRAPLRTCGPSTATVSRRCRGPSTRRQRCARSRLGLADDRREGVGAVTG
jgi:hypothetical protein